MIKPYASEQLAPLVVEDAERAAALWGEAESLPSLLLNSAAVSNAVMMAGGYFTPLTGYMNAADALRVGREMHTESGLFWPVPILNQTQDAAAIEGASRIALRDCNRDGHPVLAIQQVEAVETLSEADFDRLAEPGFQTTHPSILPGSRPLENAAPGSGRSMLDYNFPEEFAGTFRTAVQIRDEIGKLGWNRVVAFQTRNPMHRAHEELCKIAQETVDADGVLIHMLLGRLKPGDIPAHVRDAAIRKMVELYFPPNTVMITGYGFDMLYAGPREAVLHAIFRQNAGCTHLIVGRDHAGVGDYYGAFDAQTIFDGPGPQEALDIEIFRADHTAYSKKLDKVVMMRDAPDHQKEDFVLLSGTRVREMLSNGEDLPPEFARPEIARILMDYYQSL